MQLVGCGGGGNSTNLSLVSEQPDTVDFFVQPSGSEAPILTTVSGSLMDIEALEKLVIDSAKDQSEIVFLVDNQNENAPASRTEFRVGRYRIRIAFDSHGFDHSRYTLCLPQDRELRHLNFEIEDMNIKNLIGSWHLISWMNVVPQFGIYNKWTDHTKPHNLDSYCRSTQGKFTLVKERIAEALRQSTKMSDNTVSYIAYVVVVPEAELLLTRLHQPLARHPLPPKVTVSMSCRQPLLTTHTISRCCGPKILTTTGFKSVVGTLLTQQF